ncbi:MAG: M56 family metallopeptidase [bacterium]|nr:M56 family metallopeptidase [bacterium]
MRFFDWFSSQAHAHVGTLLNGIWIGLLLTALVALCWRLARRTNANTRYTVWGVLLLIVAVLPVILAVGHVSGLAGRGRQLNTDIRQSQFEGGSRRGGVSQIPQGLNTRGGGVELEVPPVRSQTLPASEPAGERSLRSLALGLLPVACCCMWIAISTLFLSRLLLGHIRIARLKRGGGILNDDNLNALLARHDAGRPVRILESTEVTAPMMTGFFRPAILLPYGLRAKLSVGDLEAVILHELAHVRRYDDWTFLTHKIIAALLFFHPAVIWIGRQLDLERELACDEDAVSRLGEAGSYCHCLTRLAEFVVAAPTPAACGLNGRRQIFRRFERLLGRRELPPIGLSRTRLTTVMGIVIAALAGLLLIAPVLTLPVGAVSVADLTPKDNRPMLTEAPTGRYVNWDDRIYSTGLNFTLRTPDGTGRLQTILHTLNDELTIAYMGDVEVDPERNAFSSISAGGFVAIRDQRRRGAVEIDIAPGGDGGLEYTYFVRGRERELDADAGRWLAEVTLEFIRIEDDWLRTRCAMLFENEGVAALLTEIETIEKERLKINYYGFLLAQTGLDDADINRVLDHVAETMEDTDNLGSVLLAAAGQVRYRPDCINRFFDAMNNVEFHHMASMACDSLLSGSDLEPEMMEEVLASAEDLDSDSVKASLLKAAAERCRGNERLQRACERLFNSIGDEAERQYLRALINERLNSADMGTRALK